MRVRDLSRRLAMRAITWLPWRAGETVLGALGVVYGVIMRRHLRQALDWGACQPGTPSRWRVALSLLANGARSLANEALITRGAADAVRRRFVLEGVEHLQAAQNAGATIVLGFHLGPGVAPLALRISGHRMTVAGLGQNPVGWPLRRAAWARFLDPGEDPFVLWREVGARVVGLRKLRRVLLDGGTICLTVDGPGTELFRIPLPGRDMVIRAGWFALRRHTGAVTLPVLAHPEGTRVVVTIHPPLPPPDADPDVDRAVCRDALSAIVTDYVRRFPGLCYSLAIFPAGVHTHVGWANRHRRPGDPRSGQVEDMSQHP